MSFSETSLGILLTTSLLIFCLWGICLIDPPFSPHLCGNCLILDLSLLNLLASLRNLLVFSSIFMFFFDFLIFSQFLVIFSLFFIDFVFFLNLVNFLQHLVLPCGICCFASLCGNCLLFRPSLRNLLAFSPSLRDRLVYHQVCHRKLSHKKPNPTQEAVYSVSC